LISIAQSPYKSPFNKGGFIELDGGQHYSSEGKEKDRTRDEYMKDIGLRVLRFSDKEVFNNTQGVLERIWEYL
jgi:very-short-patch-repair endonuclease